MGAKTNTKTKTRSVTYKYIMLFSALLLLTNMILGVVMYNQSRLTVRELVRKNMLSVSNTAAGLMDGDTLGSFTKDDVGSAEWQAVIDELSVFQTNNDIEFIYTVRRERSADGDKYVFVVDPDPENPGELGEEIVVTEAVVSAADGVASVDSEPAQDEWGYFYSAYSPVFDSKGKVSAIVGVDFDAAWYDAQIREHMKPAIYITAIFMLVCVAIVGLFSRKMLERLNMLNSKLSNLTVSVDELITELSTESNVWLNADTGAEIGEKAERPATRNMNDNGDEIDVLSGRLQDMEEELKLYQAFAHVRACTDSLTGVRNTTAYTEIKDSLNRRISQESVSFAVIVFDINYLKKINDCYGHAAGDEVIRSAGRVIARAFGHAVTFRVGGDEFLVLDEAATVDGIEEKIKQLRESIDEYNAGRDEPKLSLSIGYSFYEPDQDKSVREVFVRADEAMYENKQTMHNKL
ncbi:MAG: diguanylate cyclase [Mogibacterium sp.]|nr:diguanylate cyclase [Mogibacterium sp.]